MKAPSFWREAGVALVLSAIGAIVFLATSSVIGTGTALRGVLVLLGAGYLVALIRGLGVRVGRVVTMAAWLAVTAVLFLVHPPLWLWLLAQTGLIWLVRSLHAYESFLAAIADGMLSALALAAATVTAVHTGSVFLSFWSFFLVQALFILIPKSRTPATIETDGFDQAHRTAEAALRRLSSRMR